MLVRKLHAPATVVHWSLLLFRCQDPRKGDKHPLFKDTFGPKTALSVGCIGLRCQRRRYCFFPLLVPLSQQSQGKHPFFSKPHVQKKWRKHTSYNTTSSWRTIVAKGILKCMLWLVICSWWHLYLHAAHACRSMSCHAMRLDQCHAISMDEV